MCFTYSQGEKKKNGNIWKSERIIRSSIEKTVEKKHVFPGHLGQFFVAPRRVSICFVSLCREFSGFLGALSLTGAVSLLLLLSAHVWECVSGGLRIHPSRLSIWRPRNLLCLSGSPCLHLNPWVSGGRVLLTICVPLARTCGLPVPLVVSDSFPWFLACSRGIGGCL